MRKIILVLIIAVAIVGCVSKNRVLTLGEYGTYAKSATLSKSVFISNVIDARNNKSIVATVKDKNNMVSEYVVLTEDLSTWFRDALTKELGANGIGVEASPLNADAQVSLKITQLDATLQGYAKDNMKGKMNVNLEILRGDKTTTKQVSQTQSEFAVMPVGSSFTPFMQSMLKDIVVKTAKEIDNVL